MIRKTLLLIACCLSLWAPSSRSAHAGEIQSGTWPAWLESPGGELHFQLSIQQSGGRVRAWLTNGQEHVEIPHAAINGRSLRLGWPHYDAVIEAERSRNGATLNGTWRKTTGPNRFATLPFHARHENPNVVPANATPKSDTRSPFAAGADRRIDGRWSVTFSSADDPAVGAFETSNGGQVRGTFLTTTGDYRFLAGGCTDGRLELSNFDGAHAFLFRAQFNGDDSLRGEFWSRDVWHETWTALRDPDAALPDAFTLTSWNKETPLHDLSFRDDAGRQHTLGQYAGLAQLIYIMGTWCPNCGDATAYLKELHNRYHDKGLRIVGLAFELTGDFKRDARQVRRYIDHYEVPFPILLAGTSDKKEASKSFPVVDRIRSYPTTLFVNATGQIQAVHTGFSGPANEPAYAHLKRQFVKRIESMLSRDK